MELNWIVFPAPKRKFDIPESELKDLVQIPRPIKKNKNCLFFNVKETTEYIPCRLIQYKENGNYSDKIMIFFHGNAEDLSVPNIFAHKLSENLAINILLVEYPGYSFYPGSPSSERIEQDAQYVYDYLIDSGTKPQNIFVFGRSIGSGPSTYLAKHNLIGLLVLMSAYTSIKDVSKFLAGNFLSKFIKQRFENDKNIIDVKCPIFLIHGIKDQVVPYQHTRQLLKLSTTKHLGFSFPQEMTHNKFLINQDIINPLLNFFQQKQLDPTLCRNNVFEYLLHQKQQDSIQNVYTIEQELQALY